MRQSTFRFTVLTLMALSLGACSSTHGASSSDDRIVSSALIGAGAGAVIGAVAGGNIAAGAAIGTAAGAAVGVFSE